MPPTRFETTECRLVLAAGQDDSTAAEQALARLCVLYWYPVFAFVRKKGHAPAGRAHGP
jgi:RNA polymerase sigma-70 factor (ECF subfamily)